MLSTLAYLLAAMLIGVGAWLCGPDDDDDDDDCEDNDFGLGRVI